VVGSESWSLVWEWGSLTAIISRAPSSSLAHSGASAFPGLGALLSTLPVVGLGDGAVLVVWMGSSIFGPVTFPELLGVVVVFLGGWNIRVSKTNSWWGTGFSGDGGNKGGDSEESHE